MEAIKGKCGASCSINQPADADALGGKQNQGSSSSLQLWTKEINNQIISLCDGGDDFDVAVRCIFSQQKVSSYERAAALVKQQFEKLLIVQEMLFLIEKIEQMEMFTANWIFHESYNDENTADSVVEDTESVEDTAESEARNKLPSVAAMIKKNPELDFSHHLLSYNYNMKDPRCVYIRILCPTHRFSGTLFRKIWDRVLPVFTESSSLEAVVHGASDDFLLVLKWKECFDSRGARFVASKLTNFAICPAEKEWYTIRLLLRRSEYVACRDSLVCAGYDFTSLPNNNTDVVVSFKARKPLINYRLYLLLKIVRNSFFRVKIDKPRRGAKTLLVCAEKLNLLQKKDTGHRELLS